MKLCRYADHRLGVVRGDLVHDVTDAQTEIRKLSPYAMQGDAVVAALPQWRERLERLADTMPGKPISQVKLLAPVARPTKLTCAPTNYQAHIDEMKKASAEPGSQIVTAQSSKILEAGMFLKANSSLVGPSEGIPLRFPERRSDHEVELVMVIGKAGSDISQDRALEHVAGYCLGLDMFPVEPCVSPRSNRDVPTMQICSRNLPSVIMRGDPTLSRRILIRRNFLTSAPAPDAGHRRYGSKERPGLSPVQFPGQQYSTASRRRRMFLRPPQ